MWFRLLVLRLDTLGWEKRDPPLFHTLLSLPFGLLLFPLPSHSSCSLSAFPFSVCSLDPSMAEVKMEVASVDWQKRCLSLETQLFRFRLQASKIRELLADKVSPLESRKFPHARAGASSQCQVQS